MPPFPQSFTEAMAFIQKKIAHQVDAAEKKYPNSTLEVSALELNFKASTQFTMSEEKYAQLNYELSKDFSKKNHTSSHTSRECSIFLVGSEDLFIYYINQE